MQHSLFNSTDVEQVEEVGELEKLGNVKRVRHARITSKLGLGKSQIALDMARQQVLFQQINDPIGDIELERNAEDGEELLRNSRKQLLKWIGNKQRFAHKIVSNFPTDYNTYFEPFLGSGAVWSTLGPDRALVSDIFAPLMEIWQTLQTDPEQLKRWYEERWHSMMERDKAEGYERIKAAYNTSPNGADLLFLCRSCYGGVVRFRKRDGYMSTPCGAHNPMKPGTFAERVDEWSLLTRGTTIACMDYSRAMRIAQEGDFIYCDPPYTYSQNILYGAQSFNLKDLFEEIKWCKMRGVRVALSIDGTKRSGNLICNIPIPEGLFEREVLVDCGRSMLKRFQMDGRTLEEEVVADRLLLTY